MTCAHRSQPNILKNTSDTLLDMRHANSLLNVQTRAWTYPGQQLHFISKNGGLNMPACLIRLHVILGTNLH